MSLLLTLLGTVRHIILITRLTSDRLILTPLIPVAVRFKLLLCIRLRTFKLT